MPLHERLVKNLFSEFFSGGVDIFKTLKLLKICDIYRYNVCIHMFKFIRLNSNPCLADCLQISYPSHSYQTRNMNSLVTPFPRLNVNKMNFQYKFYQVWNELPDGLKNSRTLSVFKRDLKSFFVNQY